MEGLLANHKFKIAIDFTSLIDLWRNQLFIFILLNIDTREMIFINVTYGPHKNWLTQQFKDAFYDLDNYLTLCICDNDTIFSKWFKDMMKCHFGAKVLKIPIGRPELNGKIERLNLSLKKEAFRNVVPTGLDQTQAICFSYQKYYNFNRPHQGITGLIPGHKSDYLKERQKYCEKSHLGKKITTFELNEMTAA